MADAVLQRAARSVRAGRRRYARHGIFYRLASLDGVRVASGSPMERAGVWTGDVIEAVDGRLVASEADWFVDSWSRSTVFGLYRE
jgi:S1-C subfamily serine protease